MCLRNAADHDLIQRSGPVVLFQVHVPCKQPYKYCVGTDQVQQRGVGGAANDASFQSAFFAWASSSAAKPSRYTFLIESMKLNSTFGPTDGVER